MLPDPKRGPSTFSKYASDILLAVIIFLVMILPIILWGRAP